MSNIEKIHNVEKINSLESLPFRLIIPFFINTSASIVAFALGMGWWAALVFVAGMAISYKPSTSINTELLALQLAAAYTRGIMNAQATKSLPVELPRNTYQRLSQRVEMMEKALKSVNPKELSAAVYFGKSVTMPIHSWSVGELGSTIDYNTTIKGGTVFVSSVYRPSDMQLWEQARDAAVNL